MPVVNDDDDTPEGISPDPALRDRVRGDLLPRNGDAECTATRWTSFYAQPMVAEAVAAQPEVAAVLAADDKTRIVDGGTRVVEQREDEEAGHAYGYDRPADDDPVVCVCGHEHLSSHGFDGACIVIGCSCIAFDVAEAVSDG